MTPPAGGTANGSDTPAAAGTPSAGFTTLPGSAPRPRLRDGPKVSSKHLLGSGCNAPDSFQHLLSGFGSRRWFLVLPGSATNVMAAAGNGGSWVLPGHLRHTHRLGQGRWSLVLPLHLMRRDAHRLAPAEAAPGTTGLTAPCSPARTRSTAAPTPSMSRGLAALTPPASDSGLGGERRSHLKFPGPLCAWTHSHVGAVSTPVDPLFHRWAAPPTHGTEGLVRMTDWLRMRGPYVRMRQRCAPCVGCRQT